MRWGLLAWCALGAGVIGLKAHLDRSGHRHPDLAVSDGVHVYAIPLDAVVDADSWRRDALRLAGCWDVREAGVLPGLSQAAGCAAPFAIDVRLPVHLSADGSLSASFWRNYRPPAEHLQVLDAAWRGEGMWAGRALVQRPGWPVVRLEAEGSPFIYLLNGMPSGPDGLSALYAGRCHRPDAGFEFGMSCTFVLRAGRGVAVEYALGPDDMPDRARVQSLVASVVASWRRDRAAQAM